MSYKQSWSESLTGNILSSFAAQILSLAIPLISVPYLVRVLGVEKFGLVVFAQAVVQYVILVTDYGLLYVAPREIARNRNDVHWINRYLGIVYGAKVLLIILCLIVFTCALFFIPPLRSEAPLFLFTFAGVIGTNILSEFLFTGFEKIQRLAIVLTAIRVFSLCCLLLFIRDANDYVFVPLFYAVVQIVIGIVALVVVMGEEHLNPKRPSLRDILTFLREGFIVFRSWVAISLYTTSTVVILGAFTSPIYVGLYGGVERIARAVTGLFNPPVQSIIPRLSAMREHDRRSGSQLLKRSGQGFFLVAICCTAAMFFLAEPIVLTLLGDAFHSSVPTFRLFSFLPLITAGVMTYSNLFLIGYGLDRSWSRITFRCSVFGLVITVIAVGYYDGRHDGMALSVLLTELCVFASAWVVYLKVRNHEVRY